MLKIYLWLRFYKKKKRENIFEINPFTMHSEIYIKYVFITFHFSIIAMFGPSYFHSELLYLGISRIFDLILHYL